MGDSGKMNGLTVGYSRCSSKAQDVEDKAFGRAIQQRAIAAWSDMSDAPIDVWIHDTCTGATLDREGLAEIREMARSGRLARLVFARQDRLARDAHIAETLYKEIEALGGELVNVEMNFERNPVGRMLRRMLDNFAELDRIQIAERCNRGRREGVMRNGTHLYGYRVLGYRQVPRDECEHRGIPRGSLEIDAGQAETVRIVYALRERGHSFESIAAWLDGKGRRTKDGKRFSAMTVSKVVRNEAFYRAERVGVSAEALGVTAEEYASVRPAHPPILPLRGPGELLLAERMPSFLLKGARVPDDPFSDEPLGRDKRRYVHSLSRDYAAAVLAVRDMRAAGEPFGAIADALNEAGRRTRRGSEFNANATTSIHERMGELEPLAVEALARTLPEPPQVRADDWEGPANMARAMARNGLGRKRGEMSLAKIAAALNVEYGTTPNGGRFFPETVSRLLERRASREDGLRNVAYVRLASDGVDHQGQMDAIGEWAALNGLEIAEWYVDKAPAYSRAENPELRRLLADGEAGRYHRVAVLSLERFCVDRKVADGVMRRLSKNAEVYLVGHAGRQGKQSQRRKTPPFVPSAA